ncbi:hypothetical protein TNCV_1585771 [Trichonephila clavipes]|nr:hypothetical protein TNCV_1585771 [Trichonephila clavipes]
MLHNTDDRRRSVWKEGHIGVNPEVSFRVTNHFLNMILMVRVAKGLPMYFSADLSIGDGCPRTRAQKGLEGPG